MPKPLVAIVGRPNVGKSTLFNRIIGERRAVVSEIPGTTRDRLIAEAEWNDRTFLVVDTGGIEILPPSVERGSRPGPDTPLLEDSAAYIPLIRAQAELAIQEADLILFLTDAISGITGADREVADLLRRSQKPVLLVANKVDNERREQEAMEFYELGIGDLYTVSAIHGTGVGDLLDVIVTMLPPPEPEEEIDADVMRIAILGRPNVGKSSLLNKLLGEERAIVSPVAGTTRDALDTEMEWEGQKVVLIDTAGIRKRGKIEPGVEKYSVLRAARSLQRADVALLLIDALDGITAQDAHIAGMILDEGISVVVVVNKWDAVDAETRQNRQEFEARIREDLKFLPYIPVLFISALTGLRVNQVIPAALDVMEARCQRLPTGQLNDLIRKAMAEHAPPSKRGKRMKVYYLTQAEVAPPTFIFFVNDPELLHFSYERYLENCIRAVYPFPGTPIRLTFRGHKVDKESRKSRRQ
jgi:GTP-binding protein